MAVALLKRLLLTGIASPLFLSLGIISTEVIATHRSEKGLATVSPTHHTRSGTDVEQRHRVIVTLLHQYPDGLTAPEIREATGSSRSLTGSALSGLFTQGVVYKRGHRYVLAAQDDATER